MARRRNIQNRRPVYEAVSIYSSTRRSNPHLRHIAPSASTRGGVWMWGCMGLMALICVGVCALTVVLTPIAFRMLPEEIQSRVVRRLPMFSAFAPTEMVVPLPTLDPVRATAAAAMFSGGAGGGVSGTPSPVLGFTPPGMVVSATPNFIAVGAAPTNTGLGVAGAPTPAPIFRATATSVPLPARFRLDHTRREPQGWNNCGPANLVQAMYVLGVGLKQKEVASWLKPSGNDANVSPWQIAEYTNKFTQARGIVRQNGSLDVIKRLIYAGFGVLIETGLYSPDDGQWEGHYLTVVGWDDLGDGRGGYLLGLDTLIENGPNENGVQEFYHDLDERWKHFNRVYVTLYQPDDEWKVQEILGTAWDGTQNVQEALTKALDEAQSNPADPFAWFNVGTNYVLLGKYQEAAAAYDRARGAGQGWPWRMLWYQFGPFVAYYQTGDFTTVIEMANGTIQRVRYVEELYYYRALAYIAIGQTDQARSDLLYAAKFNGNSDPIQKAYAQMQSGTMPVIQVM